MENHELVELIEEVKNASQLFLEKMEEIKALIKYDIINLPDIQEGIVAKDIYLGAFEELKSMMLALTLSMLTLPMYNKENRGD